MFDDINAQEIEWCIEMQVIRLVEEKLLDLFDLGLLRGTVHTCIGQEACAVGVVKSCDISKDHFFSNHRCHGHYLAYSGDIFGLVAEIMGRPDGVCGGIGGSQHLFNNRFVSNGIQGAGVPISVGIGLAEKFDQTGAVSICFMGDGTFGEGAVYEAFNMASLWKSPVLFVIEHNGFAQSTPAELQHAGNIFDRPISFDIDTRVIDGSDVRVVFDTSKNLLEEIRSKSEPKALFLKTHRFAPHSKGDDFRDEKLMEKIRFEKDPLKLIQSRLSDKEVQFASRKAHERFNKAIEKLGIS